jgi:hypothetical protein
MSRHRFLPVPLALALFALARPAHAAPAQWKVEDGGNGHYYDVGGSGPEVGMWEPSRAEAASRTFAGLPGHLATITSPAEQAFIVNHFRTLSDVYLGGVQAPNSAAPDQGWSWITGEPWDFTYWGKLPNTPDEPTDGIGLPSAEDNQENYLSMYGVLVMGGRWNDVNGTRLPSNVVGYLVEYEAVTPEPSSAALTLILGALAMRRRARGTGCR